MASQHPSHAPEAPLQMQLGVREPLLFEIDMQLEEEEDDDAQTARHLSSSCIPLSSSPVPENPGFSLLKTFGTLSGDCASGFSVLAAPLPSSDALSLSQADDMKNSDLVSTSLSPFSHPSAPPSTGRRHTFDSPPPGSRFDPFAPSAIPLAPRKRREGINEDADVTMHHNSALLAKLRTLELASDKQVKHPRVLHLDAAEKANDKQVKHPRVLHLDVAVENSIGENSATLGATGSLHSAVSLSRCKTLEATTSEVLFTEDCRRFLSPNQAMVTESSFQLRTESVQDEDTLCRTPPDKIFMISSSFPPTPMAPRKNVGSLRPSPLRQKRPRRLNFEGQ